MARIAVHLEPTRVHQAPHPGSTAAFFALSLAGTAGRSAPRGLKLTRPGKRAAFAGPPGTTPPKPHGFPPSWPEAIVLTEQREARAIRILERYRRQRPGYYQSGR